MPNRLYPHQVIGAQWLADQPRAGLFDEQGLGKTVTAIAALNICVGARPVPTLIIAPAAVTWNWRREWLNWRSGYNQHLEDDVFVVSTLDSPIKAPVVIMSHRALIEPRIFEQVCSREWACVILDEAHMFRNRKAQRTRKFFGDYRDSKADAVIRHAARVWLLTGTPMPNDVRDLWPMCRWLWPQNFTLKNRPNRPMSYGAFQAEYAKTINTRWGKRVIGNRNPSDLRRRLEPNTLRRLKRDKLDLPPLRYESIVVHPESVPPQFLDHYIDAMEAEHEFQGTQPADLLKELASKQVFSTWRRVVGMMKVTPILNLLDLELDDPDARLVLFAHHVDVIKSFEHGFQQRGVDFVTITGSTPAKVREHNVEAFQRDRRVQVMLGQIVAGGIGITLTAASEVMFAELSWVPADNAQAADRVHRIGQTEPCRVRYVSLVGSVDELVTSTIKRKVRMIREVLSPDPSRKGT
jgi:SWI/SNF-related matrix-associated actin-dependent regulator 1 of chromatin subfamily A